MELWTLGLPSVCHCYDSCSSILLYDQWTVSSSSHPSTVINNAANAISPRTSSNSLLITCHVLVHSRDGPPVQCWALLDSASSAKFVTEDLSQSLNLPHSPQSTRIMGIAGLSHTPASQALTQLIISPTDNPTKEYYVTVMILPRITCDLPLHSVSFSPTSTHLSDITLADPDFGHPEKIDLLLGIDIVAQILCHGWRHSPPGSPSAFKTEFG